jgi:hypothetical protein
MYELESGLGTDGMITSTTSFDMKRKKGKVKKDL